MTERVLMKQIHRAIGGRADCRLWRVNVGRAVTERGQWMSFGLPGMADLAGILRCGQVGVALFIEVKSARGRLTLQQQRFRDMAVAFGACYIEARSVADAVNGIESFKAQQHKRTHIPHEVAEECRDQNERTATRNSRARSVQAQEGTLR